MCIKGFPSVFSPCLSVSTFETEEEREISSVEMGPLRLPENFFNRKKVEALFFEKHQVQNSSFSFAEFFSFIKGIPTLGGSFANHLCIDSISYSDIDFKVDITDVDIAIKLAQIFFKEKKIEGTFVKFASYGKNPSEINANTRITFFIGQKEIPVDIVLVQKKKRETLFDGFGFELRSFNEEEGEIIPCVLRDNEKSFKIEDLLELKDNFLKLQLNITEPTLCNRAVLRRAIEAFSKGYFLSSETRQKVAHSFFLSTDFQGKEYDGIAFSMTSQQKRVEPLQEEGGGFKENLEERVAFLMNTVFLFLESSNQKERYKEVKEENILRESGFSCFQEMYKRLKLSDEVLKKHPIFKYLQRFHSKVLERWIYLLREIALNYFIRGIALKGVKISFKEEDENLFVSMTFSEKSTFWFKLDKKTEGQNLEIKSYLAHHLPQDLFEVERAAPIFPQAQRFEIEDSKAYEKVLLKAKQPQVFSWYVERALEIPVSDSFVLFLIEKGITLFKGKERKALFERVVGQLERAGKSSEDRERLLSFLRSKEEKTETSFLELLRNMSPFLFYNLDDLSPNFWLPFLETEEESSFKNHLEILWSKVSQISQKEIACTFFPSRKEKLGLFLSPFVTQLEEHLVPLNEDEKKILKPFRVQEGQKGGQKQNANTKYPTLKGDERYSQFIKMSLSQKTTNFNPFLSFVKQDKTKALSLLFNADMREFWKENVGLTAHYISQTCSIVLLKENLDFIENLFKINPKILYQLFQYEQWALSISDSSLLMKRPFLSPFKEIAFTTLLNHGKYEAAYNGLKTWGRGVNIKAVSKNLAEKWDTFDLTLPQVFSCVCSLLELMSSQESSVKKEDENSVNTVIKKIVTKKSSKVKSAQQAADFLNEIDLLLKESFVSEPLQKELYEKVYRHIVDKFFQKPTEEKGLHTLFDSSRGKYLLSEHLELCFKNGPFKVKLKIAKNYREEIEDPLIQEGIKKLIQNRAFHEALELFIVYCSGREESSEELLTFANWKKIVKEEENEETLFQGLGLYNKVENYQLDPFIEVLKEVSPRIKSSKRLLLFIIQIPGIGEKSTVFELVEPLLKAIPEDSLTEEEQEKINQFLEVNIPAIPKHKKKVIEVFLKEEILLKGQPSETPPNQYEGRIPFYAPPFLEFFKEKWENVEDEELTFLAFRFLNNKRCLETPPHLWRKAFSRANKGTTLEKISYVYSLEILLKDIRINYRGEREEELELYLKETLPIVMKWNNISVIPLAPIACLYPAYTLPYIGAIFDLKNKNKFWGESNFATLAFWRACISCLQTIQFDFDLKMKYELFLLEAFFGQQSGFFTEIISTETGVTLKEQLSLLNMLYTNGFFSCRLKQLMDSRIKEIEHALVVLLKRYQREQFKIDPNLEVISQFKIVNLLFNPSHFFGNQKISKQNFTYDIAMDFSKKLSYHCYQALLQRIQSREPVMVSLLTSMKTNEQRVIGFLEAVFSLENVVGSIKNRKSLKDINDQLTSVLSLVLDERPTSNYSQEISKWVFVSKPTSLLPVQEDFFEGLNLVQSFLMIEKSFQDKKRYTIEEEMNLRRYVLRRIFSWKTLPFMRGKEGELVFWFVVIKPLFAYFSKHPTIFNCWYSDVYQLFTTNKYEERSEEKQLMFFPIPELDILADWLELGLSFLEPLLKPSLEIDPLDNEESPYRLAAINNFEEFLRNVSRFYIASIRQITESSNAMTPLDLKKVERFHDVILAGFDFLRGQSEDLFVTILKNWIDQMLSGNFFRYRECDLNLFCPIVTLKFTLSPEENLMITSSVGEYSKKSFAQTTKYVAIIKDLQESFKRIGREYPKQLSELGTEIYYQLEENDDEGRLLPGVLKKLFPDVSLSARVEI